MASSLRSWKWDKIFLSHVQGVKTVVMGTPISLSLLLSARFLLQENRISDERGKDEYSMFLLQIIFHFVSDTALEMGHMSQRAKRFDLKRGRTAGLKPSEQVRHVFRN